MSQFEFDSPTRVTIKNVNVRSEMHGSDHVPALDISMSCRLPNDVLSMFNGNLKSMFYQRAGGKAQPELEGVTPISDMPSLRCPLLEPVRLKSEFAGYALSISHGIGSAGIELAGCEVRKFKVDCLDGGTVELSFQVQASGVQPSVIGLVGALLGQEVEVLLTAPTAEQQAEFAKAPAPEKKRKGKALTATDIFAGATAATAQ
jgi:hypothetical protein